MSERQEARTERDEYEGPPEDCAFCEHGDARYMNEVLVVTFEDYVDAPLGEKPPVRRIGLCAHHYDLFAENSEILSWEETPL